jgi:hypothetical protein
MRTTEYVQKQIKAMGKVNIGAAKKEVEELPNILHDTEELLYMTSGFFNGSTWLIVSTSERVIFLDKGMVCGLKQLETPLDKINSISQSTGFVYGEISIWDGSSKMQIKNCIKTAVKPFVDSVNSAIKKVKEQNRPIIQQTIQTNNEDDMVSKIERLAKLKEQGILTEEEFLQSKAKILNA